MLAIFLTLVVIAVSVVAFLLTRKRPKAVAPDATWQVGPIGFVSIFRPVSARFELVPYEVRAIVEGMGRFIGKPITPIVVAFVDGLIHLDDGRTAAGVYHSADLWTHAWIELSVGGGDWWPTTLRETAFEHELLHHASGLPDSAEFKALFTKYKETHP
jgi:hypothetical protein